MRVLTPTTTLALLSVAVMTTYLSAARFEKIWTLTPETNSATTSTYEPETVSETRTSPPPIFGGPNEPGQWGNFADMHAHFTHNFVESEGFGMSRIITFDEPSRRQLRIDDIAYYVEMLNLIGLKDGSPHLYETSWLGPMRNQLASYPIRELTELESSSLDRLKAGEEFTWDLETDRSHVTLVGALRAEASCMECHQAKAGELLGAFVYFMQRNDIEPGQFLEGFN